MLEKGIRKSTRLRMNTTRTVRVCFVELLTQLAQSRCGLVGVMLRAGRQSSKSATVETRYKKMELNFIFA